jgi:PAS domain-containing protein
VNREECSERIRLTDEYSRLITEFSNLLGALKASSDLRKEGAWNAVEKARKLSQKAWDALEKHIQEHRCTDLQFGQSDGAKAEGSGGILQMAAMAALDVIMVANDEQRFVDVNDAAAEALGLPRAEIVGRQIDEFFAEANGEPFPAVWEAFVSNGVGSGMCELTTQDKRRRFMYRAKANFAPGLHLAILREVTEDPLP